MPATAARTSKATAHSSKPSKPCAMPPEKKAKTLICEMREGRQSMTLYEIVEIDGHKAEIEIKRDSYDFQSYAAVKVWRAADLSWKFVASVHFSKMKTSTSYLSIQRTADFAEDRAELLRRFAAVVL